MQTTFLIGVMALASPSSGLAQENIPVIEKALRDPSRSLNAAKADVYILGKQSVGDSSSFTKQRTAAAKIKKEKY
jgi:hypothetical protein